MKSILAFESSGCRESGGIALSLITHLLLDIACMPVKLNHDKTPDFNANAGFQEKNHGQSLSR